MLFTKSLIKFNLLPLTLSLILYVLVVIFRFQQGGWDLKFDLFKPQRQALEQKISQFLPSPQSELLSGILLGQNKKLPGNLKLALRDTSTLHIVVASGQNLSMVAGFFLGLAGLIKRKNAVILSLLATLFYTILTGFQVPILRAALMFGLASLAQLHGRGKGSFRVLMIVAGLMLLINPRWVRDISFQLSFLATFGVVVIAPILLCWLRIVPIIGQDLAVTLSAQLMVTPVIAQNFHQLSLVSLIANALVLWSIPFIMIGGTIMIILGSLWNFFGQLIALGVYALLTYFIYIVQFFASLPFAWEYVGEKVWVVWLGYYLIVGGMLVAMHKKLDVRSEKLDKEVRN